MADFDNKPGSLQDVTTALQLGQQNTNQSLTNLIAALNVTIGNLKTALGTINTTLGSDSTALIAALNALFLVRSTGTVTLGAAATTVVSNIQVQAASIILLMPTNAAAGTLVGSAKSPYISARTVGTSFTIATASGASAAGTETFAYIIVNS